MGFQIRTSILGIMICAATSTVALQTNTPPAGGRSRTLAEFGAAIEEVARNASPSVVQLEVRTRAPLDEDEEEPAGFLAQKTVSGSGVIVDPDGYIITNAHVVKGATRISVSVIDHGPQAHAEGHRHVPGKIVGLDRETDLALLKIDAHNLPTLAFFDSESVRQGQVVLALGSPLGLENTLTVGFVSAPVRHLRPDHPMFYIQTDAPINPGNSGGPLLDSEGRIVGINTLILTQSGGSEGIGFAIPSNVVSRVYRELRAGGRMRRGAIGVIVEEVTPTLATALGLERHSGVILSDVAPHGAAEAGGLQTGDLILNVNSKPMTSSLRFTATIFQHRIGDQLSIDILRGHDRLTKVVTVLERPPEPGKLEDLASGTAQVVSRLGIMAATLDEKVTAILSDLRRLEGVAVVAIPAEYAAFNPGLQPGDVIYEFNGKRIASLEELNSALSEKKSGDPVALLLERGGQLVYQAFVLD
ncbi:MAG: trypsin-like peptidase domain-containing protein [Acidobacteriales bacterium]|nr:trypsin-like peptidase domain-containing protein [Terriglobales bacterium]